MRSINNGDEGQPFPLDTYLQSDVYNIDGPAFNPKLYMDKHLREKDLSDLMLEEKVLSEQIRTLDSEMQTLMYDNYSKFINATDTIRMMKSDFKFVEKEMNCLVKNMASIGSLSEKVKDSLAEDRAKLKTLTATQEILDKLKLLVELPSRLQSYLTDKNWTAALSDLNQTKFVLKSYHSTPCFKTIRADCSQIVLHIQQRLWDQLRQASAVNSFFTSVKTLRQLGLSTSTLAPAFTEEAFKRLQSIFNDIQTRCFLTEESPSHLSKDSKDPNGHSLQPASTEGDFHANLLQIDVLHFANQITESLLSELMAYVTAYTNVFASSFLEGDYNPEDTILNIVSDQAQMEGVDLELVELETCLIDLVRKVCDNFFLLTTRRFDLEKRCCCDTGVIVRALDRIYGRVQQFTRSYTEALYRMGPPHATSDGLPTEQFTVGLFGQSSKETCTQLLQSAQSLVDDVARSRTEHHLSKICQSAVDSITELRQQLISPVVAGAIMSDSQSVYSGNTKNPSSPGCQLVPLFEKLNSSLTTCLHNGLSALQAFVNSENSFVSRTRFSEQFCLHELRERLIVGYLKFLLKFFEDMAETAAGRVPGPILLLLAKLCLTWGQSGTVGHLLGLAEEILAAGSKPWLTPSNSRSTENHLASEGRWKFSLETQPISSKEMTDLFLDTSTRLLVAFVRLEGTSLAQLLRKSVEARDWLKTLEPRSVRSVVKRLMDDIAALDAQIIQLLPSNTRGRDRLSDSRSSRSLISGIHASGSSHFLDRSGRPSTTSTGLVSRSTELDPSLATHLRRLFTQRVDIFDSVEGNRESLLLGVVKIGLKTLVESVRLQTFGKYGLQQIQVDCRYLQIHLWHFVNDEKLVGMLLDDVIYSVVQRCVDPQLMDDSIVDAICDRF